MKKVFFRAFLFLAFLFVGTSGVFAQSYVSSQDAMTLLKPEIINAQQEYLNYIDANNTKTAPEAVELRNKVNLYNGVYDLLRDGESVAEAIESAVGQTLGINSFVAVNATLNAGGTTSKGSGDTDSELVQELKGLLQN